MLYVDLNILVDPCPTPNPHLTPCPHKTLCGSSSFVLINLHRFPVGAGDFSLWVLIQQFCLLNSNLRLKHFPLKPKLEDNPVGREAGIHRGPWGTCMASALPALTVNTLTLEAWLVMEEWARRECLLLKLSFCFLPRPPLFLTMLSSWYKWGKKVRAESSFLSTDSLDLITGGVSLPSAPSFPLAGPGNFLC